MKKHRRMKIAIILLLALLVYIVVNIWASYHWLTVREYEYATEKPESTPESERVPESKEESEIRVVVLSDLHDHEFGAGNQKLIEKVRQQEPELILLVGDILNEDSKDAHVPCELIEGLLEIAPVYYSLGNHEEMYVEKDSALIEELEAAGAVVLEKQYVDLEINGIGIRLGGMYEYAFGLDGNDSAAAAPEDVKQFLEDYQDTERLKIMMAHLPDSFIFGDAASVWDVDLVVSGHDHGGQMVLPFLGGVFGGDQGWFPEYIHGMYEKDNLNLFVTSGLGSHGQVLPRFRNLPEIAVLEIHAP